MSSKDKDSGPWCFLGSYLAGLYEGDGHIFISSPKSKKAIFSISITFNLKDLPLAEHLKDATGFGWIRIKKKENACVLVFHTIDGVIYVVSLMNSYLRTPKLSKFNDLIDTINIKRNLNINKYPVNSGDLSSDSWFAGFVDADGSFGIINDQKALDAAGKITRKRRVACRLRIEQRMFDPITKESYEPIFKKIASFLGINLAIVKRNNGNEYFNITAKSRESITTVKNYFSTYPLFSSKYLDYKNWEQVVVLILKQTHYEETNLVLIEELKTSMNNSRTTFDWKHLDRIQRRPGNKLGKEKGPIVIGEKSIYGDNSLLCSVSQSNTRSSQGSYLAGLFEGDGHIWISKNLTKKKHNPRFCITFSLKNEPLAKKLLGIIQYGHISYKLKENACVLTVSPVKGLKRLVSLLNGELRTPKISQLYLLIDWLNQNHGSNIHKLPIKLGSLSNDSWLAGFVDADGSFSIQHTKKEGGAQFFLKKNGKVSCRLRIEQRMIEPKTNASYFGIMSEIAGFLNCKLLTKKQLSTDNEYYTLAATSRNSLIIITSYFEAFPLFTSKHLDYLDWSKAVKLILSNEHYTDANLLVIDHLKSKMNRSRTEFSWDHLDKLLISL